jgi:hypothetical protein
LKIREDRNAYKIWWEVLKERDHMGDLSTERRIILKLIL